eukprot:1152914-Pelagomonas_calceolata.AAC.1
MVRYGVWVVKNRDRAVADYACGPKLDISSSGALDMGKHELHLGASTLTYKLGPTAWITLQKYPHLGPPSPRSGILRYYYGCVIFSA